MTTPPEPQHQKQYVGNRLEGATIDAILESEQRKNANRRFKESLR